MRNARAQREPWNQLCLLFSSFLTELLKVGEWFNRDSDAGVFTVLLIVKFGISSLKGIQDGAETFHPPDCVHAHGHSRAMSQTIHETCLEKGGAPFFASYLRPWGCKDHTKGQEDKRLKAERWGLTPDRQGHFEIKDGRIILTKGSLTCFVAHWGPAVIDPPVCCVLQMGGRKVQKRGTGVDRGIHAAGDIYSTHVNIHVQLRGVSDTINHMTSPPGSRSKSVLSISPEIDQTHTHNTHLSLILGQRNPRKRSGALSSRDCPLLEHTGWCLELETWTAPDRGKKAAIKSSDPKWRVKGHDFTEEVWI